MPVSEHGDVQHVRVCLSCCNRVKGPKGRCPFCGGTVITDTIPKDTNHA